MRASRRSLAGKLELERVGADQERLAARQELPATPGRTERREPTQLVHDECVFANPDPYVLSRYVFALGRDAYRAAMPRADADRRAPQREDLAGQLPCRDRQRPEGL